MFIIFKFLQFRGMFYNMYCNSYYFIEKLFILDNFKQKLYNLSENIFFYKEHSSYYSLSTIND